MPELTASDITEVNGKYLYSNYVMEVEVGDTKQTSFYPQVKLMKWDNETNFSLRYSSDITDASYSKDTNDIVTWTGKDDVKVRMYEKDDPNFSDTGGFEFEFELPSKPKSNIFDLTIQTKGLKFLYQDEITDEDAQRQVDLYQKAYDDGYDVKVPTLAEAKRMMRPENVIGSYAVYHDSKKDNEYKTGKAFHIYRPEAIDSKGTKTWCDLNVDTVSGLLTITIPQKFLDSAAYPVIVDPTFGYTTAGATAAGINNTQCFAMGVTAPASVSIDKLTVYTAKSAALTPNPPGKGIIFSGTTGTRTVITDGVAPAVTITSTTASWVDLPYSSKPSVTNGNGYSLGWTNGGSWPTTVGYYDSQIAVDNTYNYTTPDDFVATWGEQPSAQLSIYATYTETSTIAPKWQHYRQLRNRSII